MFTKNENPTSQVGVKKGIRILQTAIKSKISLAEASRKAGHSSNYVHNFEHKAISRSKNNVYKSDKNLYSDFKNLMSKYRKLGIA